MLSRAVPYFVLAAGLALVYGAVGLILGAIIPPPHDPTDNLVMGASATFVCLLLLLGIALGTGRYRT